jgi:PTH1 family peptidyl-tRNA hydrolase
MIRLIVGLGNPGPEYEDTRHNAGFWWVDRAAQRLKAHFSHDKAYFGEVARVNTPLPGLVQPLWLLKPQTFMNLSGKSVGALARFFKLDPAEILVVHDELDLLPGQVKLKQGGGSAGHNGLKDISAQLGSPQYWRLRLGIGHPADRAEVAASVLRKPPSSERELVELALSKSLQALEPLLRGDFEKASRLVHAQAPGPKTPKAPNSDAAAAAPAATTAPTAPTAAAAPSAPPVSPKPQ